MSSPTKGGVRLKPVWRAYIFIQIAEITVLQFSMGIVLCWIGREPYLIIACVCVDALCPALSVPFKLVDCLLNFDAFKLL